ncbi:DUF2793 domain-containing protein [Microvirga sp. 2YAF29]|uniref:DUF2793 domain-containing protein n=1 Tax=Microvirga sp. 2YAF29 TaxID=3233031 RepID=UPI003F9ACB12
MTSTPHLALPLLAAAQAQKHVTHNEALASLDALAQLSVKERGRTTPPTSPTEGDRYLVGSGATGAFAGHEGKVALYDSAGWRFLEPRAGWLAHLESESIVIVHDGEQWQDLGRFCGTIDRVERLGIGTLPDSLNRLSAKLNAALFSALSVEEGGTGDLRFVLNKAGAANVLSQLYQRGFSGRAETGLVGSDDFSIRVSPNGAQWFDAMVVDGSSGVASFPQGAANIPRPNLIINSSFRVNQRNFAGGALASGVYGFDRWKAGPGGCTVARAADGTVTLTGPLDQVVDVVHVSALAGRANLGGVTLTLSVQDPSASLPVTVGTRAATIPAGSGRRSVTVTLDGNETGHVTVRLQPSAPCSFQQVKLEIGSFPTPWLGEPPAIEELNCRRYYQPVPLIGASSTILASFGQRVATNVIDIPCPLPVPMRAGPAFVTSGPAWTAAAPTGNQIGFYNNSTASWTVLTGSFIVSTAAMASPTATTIRLLATSAFSATAGTSGVLHLGSSASIALQAEL